MNQDEGTPFEDEIFENKDIKKIMNKPFIDKAHFGDQCLEDGFFIEMYERKTEILFKNYDLRTVEVILEDSISFECESCFDRPILLSERSEGDTVAFSLCGWRRFLSVRFGNG